MTKKKKKVEWRLVLGAFELMVGLCCLAMPVSVFWLRLPNSAAGIVMIFLAMSAFFLLAGLRNIGGERPEKEQQGGRKWWPAKFLTFIGNRLYGVSATIIQRPFIKKAH